MRDYIARERERECVCEVTVLADIRAFISFNILTLLVFIKQSAQLSLKKSLAPVLF